MVSCALCVSFVGSILSTRDPIAATEVESIEDKSMELLVLDGNNNNRNSNDEEVGGILLDDNIIESTSGVDVHGHEDGHKSLAAITMETNAEQIEVIIANDDENNESRVSDLENRLLVEEVSPLETEPCV